MISKYFGELIALIATIFLLFSSLLRAQTLDPGIEHLEKAFETKVTNVLDEKIYVHTDRNLYITGETIWLKVYCVDAAFHIPSNVSKVVSVELFDSSGKEVKQERLQLVGGMGEGRIFISPDMPTGTYVLRAYTNWMKNFDPNFVYHDKITVVNPLVKSIDGSTVKEANDGLIVNFFPEGGCLVEGLESKVAVKVTDSFGKGIRLTGAIFDEDENEIATFSTSTKGYASFNLIPEVGKIYNARVVNNGIQQKIPLPKADQSGLVMKINNTQEGNFSISLISTKDFNQSVYLVVHTRGILEKVKQINLVGNEMNLELDRSEINSGITHITILDWEFKPIAERLIFKYPSDRELINLSVGRKDYLKREKVTLSINSNELSDKDVKTNFSVAVFRTDTINQLSNNIVSNLLLTSDIKGTIPDAMDFFDPANENRKGQMDLVMLTNGWRKFNWNEIRNDSAREIKYLPEINAPIISGRLQKGENGILPTSLQISFWGKSSFINSSAIGADGRFYFEVPFRIKNKYVYFLVDNDTLTSKQLILNSPFDFYYPFLRKSKFSLTPESKEYIEALSVNTQILQIYRRHSKINGEESVETSINEFYGQPDNIYLLDDYTRFETVQDLFIEYVRLAYLRKKNKKTVFYVHSETPLDGRPLVMIDGVPISDTEFVLSFDPLKIEKIDIVNQMYYLGDTNYGGIINFTTYKYDFDQLDIPDYFVERVYNALQTPRFFYSPDYGTDSLSRIPDYRNTLYWNPNVTVKNGSKADLEFYTSDDTGSYQIQIEGITTTGEPVCLTGNFNVVEKIRH